MPDSGKRDSDRSPQPSPTRPRYVADKPKVLKFSENSPPSSPRRSSAASSSQLAQVPRSQSIPADTPRAAPVDVVDRNIKAALAVAGKILSRKGGKARLEDFDSVLSQAAAIAPAIREEVLLALAKCWYSLPEGSQGACLAELRELSIDMSPAFRKAFLQQLLKQLTSNRDSSSDEASDDTTLPDAKQFKSQHDRCEKRRTQISQWMKQDVIEEGLDELPELLKKTGSSSTDRGVIDAVIVGLDELDPAAQKQVVNLFAGAGLSCTHILGALIQSCHQEEIEGLARSAGVSLSARYLGVLTGDRVAMQKLLLTLGRASLPESLHVYLAEEIGKLRRTAAPPPTVAAASRAVLLEIVSMSAMSEAKRCLLMHAVSEADAGSVLAALNGGELNNDSDYWAYAHQVMAGLIDIGSCYALVDDNDHILDLASYAARARQLTKDAAVKLIVQQKKCTWDAPRLRALILGKVEVKEVKRAIFNVLSSNLSPALKLALLKCETQAVGETVEAYVRQAEYQALVEEYKKEKKKTTLESSYAFEVIKEDWKKYKKTYEKLEKDLNADAIAKIQTVVRTATSVAKCSRLPALHIAAIDKADLVRGYMQTVVGFFGQLPEKEIAAALELSCNGISLLHHAMLKGSGDVVEACVSVILDSELSLQTKLALLEARRPTDKLGALYLAMSVGVKNTAIEFTKAVLRSSIDKQAKLQLLRCAKPASAKKVDSATVLKEAAQTAHAEAERMGHHDLATSFEMAVEHSDLNADEKLKLQTT
jgi:hypothetical protein